MKKLIIASANKHKIEELTQMLTGLDYEVSGLEQFPDYISPKETGKTFLENARIKAHALRNFLLSRNADTRHTTILADDSGIECDDLNGAPGIYSARYARGGASDTNNNRKLITELRKIPKAKLTARYVCALVFVDEKDHELDVTETCEGKIVFEPKGQNGFGYDPYFFVPEHGKTMAELPPEIKNQISHRGKALRTLVQKLKES